MSAEETPIFCTRRSVCVCGIIRCHRRRLVSGRALSRCRMKINFYRIRAIAVAVAVVALRLARVS